MVTVEINDIFSSVIKQSNNNIDLYIIAEKNSPISKLLVTKIRIVGCNYYIYKLPFLDYWQMSILETTWLETDLYCYPSINNNITLPITSLWTIIYLTLLLVVILLLLFSDFAFWFCLNPILYRLALWCFFIGDYAHTYILILLNKTYKTFWNVLFGLFFFFNNCEQVVFMLTVQKRKSLYHKYWKQ